MHEEGVWIEDGLPEHSMVKDLLGDNPKTAQDGSKYRVIRFEHAKGGPTSQTPAEQDIVKAIKSELRKVKIPWKGIERDTTGKPKSGVLHRLDINAPLRPAHAEVALTSWMANAVKKAGGDTTGMTNQHGYGQGDIGQPLQGPTGIPFLKGLQVSQNLLFNDDGTPKMNKKGQQMATRSIATFRIVSSKHEAQGRWMYPGIEGVHLFDEALLWCERTWEQEILPSLIKKFGL